MMLSLFNLVRNIYRRYNYATRLQLLKLESLEAKRVNDDLILCYKIVYGHVDIDKKIV